MFIFGEFKGYSKKVYIDCPQCKNTNTYTTYFKDVWCGIAVTLSFTLILKPIGLVMLILTPLVCLLNRNIKVECEDCVYKFVINKSVLKIYIKNMETKILLKPRNF